MTKMKLEWEQGNKSPDDRIILFTSSDTKGNPIIQERVSIFKVCLLANQLAINELVIKGQHVKKKNPHKVPKETPYGMMFFQEAVNEAIEDARLGVDWADPQNESHINNFCKKYYIRFEKIEGQLKRTYHSMKLTELENETC